MIIQRKGYAIGFVDRFEIGLDLQKVNINRYNPTNGDLDPKPFNDAKQPKRKWIIINNVFNGLSWVISPVIGVIRFIAAACMWKNEKAPHWDGYYKAVIASGLFELIGGGYILFAVDLVVTAVRYPCSSRQKPNNFGDSEEFESSQK